jgi:hypothetical protein
LNVKKITIKDLIDIRQKTSVTKADVKTGDLIKAFLPKEVVIGIVLFVDENSMQVSSQTGSTRWLSRFVKYEVI